VEGVVGTIIRNFNSLSSGERLFKRFDKVLAEVQQQIWRVQFYLSHCVMFTTLWKCVYVCANVQTLLATSVEGRSLRPPFHKTSVGQTVEQYLSTTTLTQQVVVRILRVKVVSCSTNLHAYKKRPQWGGRRGRAAAPSGTLQGAGFAGR